MGVSFTRVYRYDRPVLKTCATFSATAPLARTEKGGARRGGAKAQKKARWQWRKNKMALIRAISALFSNKILHRNLDKLLLI